MKTIIIQKNISQALDYYQKNTQSISNAYFLIDAHATGARKTQEEEDFHFIKTTIPQIQLVSSKDFDNIDVSKEVYFFGWDAVEEQKIISKLHAMTMSQNRLFDQFEYEKIKSFTPFRKIAEKLLPEYFQDNTFQAKDPEVEDELAYYFQEKHLAKDYFNIRNGVVGRDYSTKFSSPLSSGRLNVRYLYNYLKDYEAEYGSNKSTYWIQFELLWREFFYWSYQKHKKKFFSKDGLKESPDFTGDKEIKNQEVRPDSLFQGDFFMLAACRELEETGFVSNRIRQIFASTWIHKYKLDWRLGAYYYEKNLKDYDVYSNWGNWQYLAGVGHDPRGSRVFNVIKQLETYDKDFEHIQKWLEISDKDKIMENLKKRHGRLYT